MYMRKLNHFSNFTEPLLDLATSAALLGVSVSTVTRYIEDGTLAAVVTHRGKRKLSRKIRPSTLHAFLSGNATPEGAGGAYLPPPLLPPLTQIRLGGLVGFNGMPEPPINQLIGGDAGEGSDENLSGINTEDAEQEGEQTDVVTPN
jgi:excisionase family DNA binding protein